MFVSILNFIFVSEPWFNEPGYEAQQTTAHGRSASEKYNRSIRQYTMQAAIMNQLQRPPKFFDKVGSHSLTHSLTHLLTHSSHSLTHSPLAITRALTQVVRRHFREKRDAIEKQCNDWLGLDPNNHALRTSVAAVRAELRKLE